MPISALDLFTIGIGPSSSHAIGPMRAARRFLDQLIAADQFEQTASVKVTLYGALALTGKGHGTDRAVVWGLAGEHPDTIDPQHGGEIFSRIAAEHRLMLDGRREIAFDPQEDIVFERRQTLPRHPNALQFTASDRDGAILAREVYYSIGGGFVMGENDRSFPERAREVDLPYPFATGREMLQMAEASGLSVSEMTWRNERCYRSDESIREEFLRRWEVMRECAERGCRTEGILPGGLKVRRRAPELYRKLSAGLKEASADPLGGLDWVDTIALAVSEENAAGGRVVTAPTNGAAGIIPAVLHFFTRYYEHDDESIVRFFLTAGAVGLLFKENASISGAEVGCQGEVGVACSMAAAALTEVLGGSVAQVEQAAEIGMEHNLGLTCDPVGGLVQVPCIERNAMGAVKAINASRLALRGTGEHRISLDRVIDTMRRTGADMSTKYKETSRGGLAVNVAEC